MKTIISLAGSVATSLLLCSCTFNIESHYAAQMTQEEQAMAVCGLGVIQTPNGPRPAIYESGMPVEAYRTYTDCVQKITKERAQADKTEAAKGAKAGT